MSKPLAQFSYDIWGDRVNIASRLQTHELPNAVHVSDPVFERLKARFEFEDTREASRWRKTLSWAEGEMEGYMRT